MISRMRLPARGVNGGSAALNGAPFLARAQSAAMDSTGGLGWRDVPNALTIARVAALPVLAYAFYSPRAQRSGATVLLYAAIAATDAVDGFIARRFELISPFGAFLDPVRPERESRLCRRMKLSAARRWRTNCSSASPSCCSPASSAKDSPCRARLSSPERSPSPPCESAPLSLSLRPPPPSPAPDAAPARLQVGGRARRARGNRCWLVRQGQDCHATRSHFPPPPRRRPVPAWRGALRLGRVCRGGERPARGDGADLDRHRARRLVRCRALRQRGRRAATASERRE